MKDEINEFIKWVKDHRKQLLLIGLSVSVILLIALSYKNKEALAELWKTLKDSVNPADIVKIPVAETVTTQKTTAITELSKEAVSTTVEQAVSQTEKVFTECYVNEHLRKLPKGQHPSAEKIKKLKQYYNHSANDGYTYVNPYTRQNKKVA